jgi:hypothetical protein
MDSSPFFFFSIPYYFLPQENVFTYRIQGSPLEWNFRQRENPIFPLDFGRVIGKFGLLEDLGIFLKAEDGQLPVGDQVEGPPFRKRHGSAGGQKEYDRDTQGREIGS